ncbi:MAG: hypothetical protein HYR94_30715 [Chloroflexi bacterium]|nr:hypothetical protein [Chloroflexota bacterium]
MSDSLVDELNREVNERQQDLNDTQLVLESYAARESGLAKWMRVFVIFLGAFAATQAVADKLLGADSIVGTVIYAVVGLLIATLGGIEAAFGFQKKTTNLRKLTVECKAYILDIDCQIPQDINADIEDRIKTLRNLLTLQNNALKDIQGKAADIGVNITRKVRHLRVRTEPGIPEEAT